MTVHDFSISADDDTNEAMILVIPSEQRDWSGLPVLRLVGKENPLKIETLRRLLSSQCLNTVVHDLVSW